MKETLHIYTRVSTSKQEVDGTSLETQKELGIERSKVLGMKYKVWNEGAESSSKDDLDNRPVITELLSEVEQGNVKHIYVWNTDRLSRNIQTWGMIRLRFIQKEVHLHTPTGEQVLSDIQTNLMIGVMSEFAQYDNLLRKERFRLGRLKSIKSGGWKGGPPPFGYYLQGRKLVIHPEESKWVIKTHEWYRDGMTPAEIKDELLLNGVLTRRGNAVWALGSINALLTNTHYDGYWYFTDKKSKNTIRSLCPRICSPELIQGVKQSWQKRRYRHQDSQRGKTSVTKHTYLLSKILKCGSCGSFYYGNRKKTQTSYYHCGNKTNKYRDKHQDNFVVCGSERNVRIDTTDEVIWDVVKDVLSSSNQYKETIKEGVVGTKGTYKQSQLEKKRIKKRIDHVEYEVQKITDSIVNLTTENLLSETRDLKQVIKKLEETRNQRESEVQELTTNLQELDSQRKWVDWLKVWKDRILDLDRFTYEEKHEFLKGIVSEVIINEVDKQKHHLELVFQFPWVGDRLVYTNPDNKSEGYKISKGRKRKTKKVDLRKKSVT
jgi:site-specific DNA recombinase